MIISYICNNKNKIMASNNKILYIVVPCYKEEAMLPLSAPILLKKLNELIAIGKISDNSRILFVNDGSQDNTWPIIKALHEQDIHYSGVNLAGNVGHQNALVAGLTIASEKADYTISIDADLQDDINAFDEMLAKAEEGCDIVYGVRKERKTDTFFKRNTALAFYKIMEKLGVKSIYNHADYRLMSKRATKFLCSFRERNLFLRGMVPLIGYKTDCVYYNRSERLAGDSKYPLGKMINFAIEGITSFSVKPVRMVFFTGVLFLIIAVCVLTYVLYSYFKGEVVPGWSSLMVSMWFIGGSILAGMGIVGEYVGKIYLEVKDRPRFNIESVLD